jgi:uncharacterized delta-60 repeat protein
MVLGVMRRWVWFGSRTGRYSIRNACGKSGSRLLLEVCVLERRELPAAWGLDPAFAAGGTQTIDFAGLDIANAAAVQADGKIVLAGYTDVGGHDDVAVVRLNGDGSLDTSFNGTSKQTIDFAGGNDVANAVAVQGDGKIVLAGAARVAGSDDFAVVRLNADGSLDTTFSGDGRLTIDAPGYNIARAMVLQSDGKIVLAGTGPSGGFGVVRLNGDGALDTSFSDDGLQIIDFGIPLASASAAALAMTSDGRIVLAGSLTDGGGQVDFAVARLNSDGALDTFFDGDGRRIIDFSGGNDFATAVAVQDDGKIVLAGSTVGASSVDFAVVRLHGDGAFDMSFSDDGKFTLDFAGSSDGASAVALQGDGKIVLAGSASSAAAGSDFGVLRLDGDGALDPFFSDDGLFTLDLGGISDAANAVALQGDGKIVLAGAAFVAGSTDFAAARLALLPDDPPPSDPPPPPAPAPSLLSAPVPSVPLSVSLVPLRSRPGRPTKLVLRIPLASGELQEIISPFQKPRFTAIKVTLQDTDGDGFFDSVLVTARKGKKKVSRTITL